MFNLVRQALTKKTVIFHYDHHEHLHHLPPPDCRNYKRTRDNIHIVMNGHVPEPAKKEAVVHNKNTGFPEPFSEDRNTTLPHPDADTSPNATIEATDLNLTRTHSRGSFLSRKHHLHHQWAKHDTPEKMGLYDNITYVDGDVESIAPGETRKPSSVMGAGEEPERKKGVLRKLALHKP